MILLDTFILRLLSVEAFHFFLDESVHSIQVNLSDGSHVRSYRCMKSVFVEEDTDFLYVSALAHEFFLKKFRVDVLSVGCHDNLFDTTSDLKSVFVEDTHIASVEPAVSDDVVSLLFAFVVTLHNVVSFDAYLAFFRDLDFDVRKEFTSITYFTSSWTGE